MLGFLSPSPLSSYSGSNDKLDCREQRKGKRCATVSEQHIIFSFFYDLQTYTETQDVAQSGQFVPVQISTVPVGFWRHVTLFLCTEARSLVYQFS